MYIEGRNENGAGTGEICDGGGGSSVGAGADDRSESMSSKSSNSGVLTMGNGTGTASAMSATPPPMPVMRTLSPFFTAPLMIAALHAHERIILSETVALRQGKQGGVCTSKR